MSRDFPSFVMWQNVRKKKGSLSSLALCNIYHPNLLYKKGEKTLKKCIVYVCYYLSVNLTCFITASSLPIIPPAKIDNLFSPFHFYGGVIFIARPRTPVRLLISILKDSPYTLTTISWYSLTWQTTHANHTLKGPTQLGIPFLVKIVLYENI